jgi:hypothetical protein
VAPFRGAWVRGAELKLWGRAPGDQPTATEPSAVLAGTGDDDLRPSTMRGNETRYGYVVALELLVVAVLNLAVTHGKGAPKHPQTTLAVIGVAAAVGLVPLLRTQNRMVVGFGSIIAAFFVTLPRTPSSLSLAHIFALAIPLIYTLLLTQRQRRETTARLKQNRGAAPPRQPRKRRKDPEEPAGPQPNRRYTPPKAKRPAGKGASGRSGRR